MASLVLPAYQGNNWERLSDNTIEDETTTAYCKIFRVNPEELSASNDLSDRIGALALKEGREWEDINKATHDVEEKWDLPYGIALPSLSNEMNYDVVLARGTALSHNARMRDQTDYAEYLAAHGHHIRNSWNVLGDKSVSVVNTTNGPMALYEWHAGNRQRKFIDGLAARMDSRLTAEAEEQAVALLKTKVKAQQYRCYLLNNAFVEQSKRSGIFYFFRKGLPVVAISYHGYPQGRIIACLCLHPYGYYRGTHAGVMTPTDEVIAQLLLMRANEHKFWAKSGQWSASDSRSGL